MVGGDTTITKKSMKEENIADVMLEVAAREKVSVLNLDPASIVRFLKQRFQITMEGVLSKDMLLRFIQEKTPLIKVMQEVFPGVSSSEINNVIYDKADLEDHRGILKLYGENLSTQALAGAYSSLAVRSELVNMEAVLLKKQKANVLLTGPTRCGKTSLVHLYARQNPGVEVFGFSLARLLQGTMYRGMAEERLEQILTAATRLRAVLFFDEASVLFLNKEICNQLKPYLSTSAGLRIIAALTDQEAKLIEADKAMMERFTQIHVPPFKSEELAFALWSQTSHLCNKHGVGVDKDIVARAEKIARQIYAETFLDHFIDLIDLSCVLAKNENRLTIELKHLIRAVEIQTGRGQHDIVNLL
jgi:ATP-dependent Clp protease ATP-binding subunit ClpA